MLTVFATVGLIAFVVVFWATTTLYIEVRKGLNALLEAAHKDFFDATSKIMKTPDEVPAEALEMLVLMGDMAMDRREARVFLRFLRRVGKQSRDAAPAPDWTKNLRPELRAAFDQAAGAWFGIMINTFTVTGLFIRIAMAQQTLPRRSSASSSGNGIGPVGGKVLAFTDQHNVAA